jgi:hypothetical protein
MCAVCNLRHGVQVHHIVPRHEGGSDDASNAIPLCPNCHSEVHEDRELADRLQQTATHARFWNHDAADLASMLAGLQPVGPGVCEVRRWIAGTGGEPAGEPAYVLTAVGVKSS